MDQIILYVKGVVILSLLLSIFVELVPENSCRKYVRFFHNSYLYSVWYLHFFREMVERAGLWNPSVMNHFYRMWKKPG